MTSVYEERGATLQDALRDLLRLAVVGDHRRWVVVGDDGEFAVWLGDAVPQWRALADDVAEHLATLGVPPDGRVRALAKDFPLNWVPAGWLRASEGRLLLAQRLRVLAYHAQQRRAGTSDPQSARLLDAVCAGLERRP
jgi:starvation-inducible DNA-binding protein